MGKRLARNPRKTPPVYLVASCIALPVDSMLSVLPGIFGISGNLGNLSHNVLSIKGGGEIGSGKKVQDQCE